MGKLILLAVSNVVFSWFSLEFVYRYLKKKNIIDIPNKRSLHSEPKVRAGGIAILASYLLFIFLYSLFGYIGVYLLLSQFVGSLILGTTGWFDDRKGLPVWIRFSAHICSSVTMLFLFNGMPSIYIFDRQFHISLFGTVFMIFFSTWMINLYNFMDGIDGLAISQLIVPSIFLATFFGLNGYLEITYLTVIMILSSMCFYKYNWPPSRMFMGDVLSGFLGYYFAFLTLYINNVLHHSFFIVPLLMSVFIYDASFTLIKRIINKEKIWHAHSSHYYQQFAKVYGHKKVSIAIIIINILLYFPSFLLIKFPTFDVHITILTYLLLAVMILFLKRKLLKNV